MSKPRPSQNHPSSHPNQTLGGSSHQPLESLPAYPDGTSTGSQQAPPEYAQGSRYSPLSKRSSRLRKYSSSSAPPPEKSPQAQTAAQPSCTFQLKDKKENVKISITIFAHANQKGHPIIHPGETIRGHLTVDSGDRQKGIKSVVLTVCSSLRALFYLA
jgi:hypothetical protein